MRDWVDARSSPDGGRSERAELGSGPRALSCPAQSRRIDPGKTIISDGRYLLCETLGEFNQNTPIGGILDFSEGDDEPQPFDDVQIDLIVAKQLQQFIPGVIGIVDVHRARSGRP